ncbi:hypothetical protein [Butyrivibrio sp. FCS014]|uniref:hypothetical protein n=1 Tax=Butyrivibrio sp. FCS014 TaxID=1408304 RepID=UPI001A997A85|nr:hypothetical protein [Butyrivibrio sp. FCS014]
MDREFFKRQWQCTFLHGRVQRRYQNREFNSVYEAYVTFDNQVNFLEVSFNAEIQQEYEAIKGNMSIEDTVEKLIRQIDALHSINLNKQDEKRNIILAFITVLSLVTGCMQVTESFGPTPNIAANIIAGAASLIIGLVLFFLFCEIEEYEQKGYKLWIRIICIKKQGNSIRIIIKQKELATFLRMYISEFAQKKLPVIALKQSIEGLSDYFIKIELMRRENENPDY